MPDVEAARRSGTARSVRFREAVLQAARQFKSSWFDLARLLVQVRREGLFTDWGYDSFESYCAKELHLRRRTALKLTRSYSFLDKHDPEQTAGKDAARRAPAFEVVEVLAGAEERGQLSSEEYRAIREAIWDPDRSAAQLKHVLAARFPPPVAGPGPSLARFAHTARRLANELRSFAQVPRPVRDRAALLADELEAIASQVEDDSQVG